MDGDGSESQKSNMNACLHFAAALRCQEMRVEVSTEEDGLKEEQTGRPDIGSAAKPGKDGLTDERLYLKQQKRADKDGHGEQDCDQS